MSLYSMRSVIFSQCYFASCIVNSETGDCLQVCCVFNFVISLFYVVLKVQMSSLFI